MQGSGSTTAMTTAQQTNTGLDSSTGGETEGDTEGNIDEFPGLTAPVEIMLDTRGIPHIYGETDADVTYAAGYQMATDRLFQMDLVRRRAMGRQAEVLGPNLVGQDETSLMFDLPRWGAANVERLRDEDPDAYRLIVAWIAGVNQRIEEVLAGDVETPYGFDELGYMPEMWTPEEHSAIAKLMALGNSNSLERELLTTIIQRNFPETYANVELARPMYPAATMPPDGLPTAAPPAPTQASSLKFKFEKPPIDATPTELAAAMRKLLQAMGHVPAVGSNNWAIDGRFTENGRPLIAGDPHQPLQSPSLMYTLHLNSADAGGNLDVIGWSFTGTSGVSLGHNRHVHWTATTNFADVMDIWEVEVVDDGAAVRVGDTTAPIEVRSETIAVAGAGARTYEVQDVPGYGVLLPADLLPIPIAAPGNALLLNWTGFAATNEESCFSRMTTATNIEEYEAAADLMEVGGFNFISADAEGISYRVTIQIPDRGDPSARPMPFTVIDGNDPNTFWDSSFLPPDQLPHSRGEVRGWLATANNDPWGFTFDGDVSNDPWYYGYFYAAGHRAQRIHEELERLTAIGNLTVEDMQTLQTDTHSVLAASLRPVLEEAYAAVPVDEALAEFRDDPDLDRLYTLLTSEWNGQMERDQAGALAFHLWLLFLTEEVIGDELGLLYQTVLEAETPFIVKLPVLAILGEYPSSDVITEPGRDVLVMTALRRAADLLIERYGNVDPAGYRWGDLHGVHFRNPYGGELDGGWVPTDGGEDTVNVSSSKFLDDSGSPAERFDASSGAIFRVVTTFAEDGTPEAYANFPPGNSADPESPHFNDTLDDWVEDQYSYLPFRTNEVMEAAEDTIVLMP